jgi:hypothetical protein
MVTRIIMLMLIAVLALPVATLTRPTETSRSTWGDVAVEAKGKKHKKARKPKFSTVRQEVTRTFSNAEPITVFNDPDGNRIPATPYPTAIEVSGFSNGTITDVNLSFTGLTYNHPDGLDVLLNASDGRRALVMSDRGGIDGVVNLDLTLDDEAAAELPTYPATLSSGTFRPTNNSSSGSEYDDAFDAPAPAPDGSIALSTFDGSDPNGAWQLWVMDDGADDVGVIAGWALEITAEVDVKVKHKKKHKKGKGRH